LPGQFEELPEISRGGLSEATPPEGDEMTFAPRQGVPEARLWSRECATLPGSFVISCVFRGCLRFAPQPPANFWQASGLRGRLPACPGVCDEQTFRARNFKFPPYFFHRGKKRTPKR